MMTDFSEVKQTARTMEESYWIEKEDETEDLSYTELISFPQWLHQHRSETLKYLKLNHNNLNMLPGLIGSFVNLTYLDISNNSITYLTDEFVKLNQLKVLIAKNNGLTLDSLPKQFGLVKSLEVVNFGGNNFTEFPPQILELSSLKCLHLGANKIVKIPSQIYQLSLLRHLYVGGNELIEVPAELGHLSCLESLVLCDNAIQTLPTTLSHLRNLRSLSLHNNQLQTLPPAVASLDLIELSLRNNPLVVRFVRDLPPEMPSLLELAGRIVKTNNIQYTAADLPRNLIDYLKSAQRCVNPRCKGVYFSSHVEHVKFVDFCGKYRLPLLQYLCSVTCTIKKPSVAYSNSSSSSESETDDLDEIARKKLKKVLLG
ncbi:leucine-rich repeat-containing protein 58-like [Tubulanus polymorphus]|uniref:leucine-rich repeat-containing protein 58-like n=1 Tax=Tubulanus polymorphus TaxID=672921 RepID=UPI003DA5B428